MNEFIAIFGSILLSFILGLALALFFGGGTTINYLRVKLGKQKKILIWVDTPLGRISKVGKIEGELHEGVVSWKYRKELKLTELKKDYVGDFLKVKYIAVNVETPERPYNLTVLGEKPALSIDQPTFNNILKRAATKPVLDDELAKKVKFILLLLLVNGGICLVVLFKILNIEKTITSLGVI